MFIMKKKPLFTSMALLLAVSPTLMAINGVSTVQPFTNTDSSAGRLVDQAKKVTGTVVDVSGVPVIGANVIVKGTTNGTITDMDGKFTIEDVPEGSILVVSYIGYVDQNITVGKKGDYSITLKEDSQALDEVVVVGYGVQKKVNMTGSIANVKADELTAIPNTNLSNSLAARRAPGSWPRCGPQTASSGPPLLAYEEGVTADDAVRVRLVAVKPGNPTPYAYPIL